MFVFGAGLGLTMQVVVTAVQNSVDRRHMGVATASVTFFRSMGGAIGMALFGAILNTRLPQHLNEVVPAQAQAQLGRACGSVNDVTAIQGAARAGQGLGAGGLHPGDGRRVPDRRAVHGGGLHHRPDHAGEAAAGPARRPSAASTSDAERAELVSVAH